ncbi:MAG: hypothetical protein ACFE8N_14855, partial [Promethearchaeota archaeon]
FVLDSYIYLGDSNDGLEILYIFEEEENILGYNLMFLLGIMLTITITLIKIWRSLRLKNECQSRIC